MTTRRSSFHATNHILTSSPGLQISTKSSSRVAHMVLGTVPMPNLPTCSCRVSQTRWRHQRREEHSVVDDEPEFWFPDSLYDCVRWTIWTALGFCPNSQRWNRRSALWWRSRFRIQPAIKRKSETCSIRLYSVEKRNSDSQISEISLYTWCTDILDCARAFWEK